MHVCTHLFETNGSRVASELEEPWWVRYNDDIHGVIESGWGENSSLLSPEICVLLAEVDAEFVAEGGDSGVWPNPHADGTYVDESEFGRCPDPSRFLLVAIRAQAWVSVLLERGWATVTSDLDWALRPLECGGADVVLAPLADGAVPLVLTTHQPSTTEHPVNISIAAGDPAVSLASIPDCACDGCDSGSAALIEEIDTWILSVVDGSLAVAASFEHYSCRTSFHCQSGTVQNLDRSTSFTAAPWPQNWSARSLVSET
ncbi:DUF6226 family protein [Rhodococcoides yunnanense]|uniref:DUF6226 family protein n=1 Tax=Rhodococcoides yunnanense TaxID=278209 RepID=A0ABU4BCQ2_9NOCA|nr:DUF6226 family protein [Rhodococcus yunnanensis]MDV6261977.1 DUF6226 family protein [Rhodococcus yunnanensis]